MKEIIKIEIVSYNVFVAIRVMNKIIHRNFNLHFKT